MFLPREQSCSLEFLQGILSGQKRYLYQANVKMLDIPCWPELAPKRIWREAAQLEGFLDYMPGGWKGDDHKT